MTQKIYKTAQKILESDHYKQEIADFRKAKAEAGAAEAKLDRDEFLFREDSEKIDRVDRAENHLILLIATEWDISRIEATFVFDLIIHNG